MKKTAVFLLCVLMGVFLCSCGFDFLTSNQENNSQTTEQTIVSSEPEKEAENSSPFNADTDTVGTTFLGYIELGTYPQTIAYHKAVNEMSTVVDETGYYFSTYDNEHYAKVSKSKVEGNRYKFTDDDEIKSDSVYYFKVEPIKWKVYLKASLKNGEVQVYMISDLILDSSAFCTGYKKNMSDSNYYRNDNTGILANNWSYSNVRSFLNNEFLNTAFSTEDRAKLISRSTSSVNKNEKHNSKDDEEWVWVPSYEEANRLTVKKSVTTDYARVRNTFMSIYDSTYGCGRYWTTTSGSASYRVAYIAGYTEYTTNSEGKTYKIDSKNGESVGATFIGVRPVISVMLSDALQIQTEEE